MPVFTSMYVITPDGLRGKEFAVSYGIYLRIIAWIKLVEIISWAKF
jgi:hypothetical protein